MPKEVGYYSIHLKLACESMMWPKVSVDVDLGYMVQFCLKQTKIKVMLYHRKRCMTATPSRELVVSYIDLLLNYNVYLLRGRDYHVFLLSPI